MLFSIDRTAWWRSCRASGMCARQALAALWRRHSGSSRPALDVPGQSAVPFCVLDRWARELQVAIGGGRRVALALDRCAEAVAVVLACLQCTSVSFVPLPLDPGSRTVARMLEESRADMLFISASDRVEDWCTRFPHVTIIAISCKESSMRTELLQSTSASSAAVIDDVECCCLFTSGSTSSMPSSCIITWAGVHNRFRWMWEAYPFTADDRLAWTTPFVFVDALWQILGRLLHRIVLVVVDPAACCDVALLDSTLRQCRVSRFVSIPSVLRSLLRLCWNRGPRPSHLHLLISSGEPLDLCLAASLRRASPGTILLNLYGSTEATGDSLFFEWSRFMSVPTGCGGDPHCDWDTTKSPLCPIGYVIPGNLLLCSVADHIDEGFELVLSGVQVSGEGLGGPFPTVVPDSVSLRTLGSSGDVVSPGTCIRTGDIIIVDDAGLAYYLGRASRCRTAKHHGRWVHFDDIEACLHSHPNVSRAVALTPSSEQSFLAAFICTLSNANVSEAELRSWCAGRLQPFMVPTVWAMAQDMPLTISGKPDMPAIRDMLCAKVTLAGSAHDVSAAVVPGSPVADAVVKSIAEALHVDPSQIGYDDDVVMKFGLDSLAASHAAALIQQALGMRTCIRVSDFGDNRTVRALERLLKSSISMSRKRDYAQISEQLPYVTYDPRYKSGRTAELNVALAIPKDFPSPVQSIVPRWKIDTGRCVDATPLVVTTTGPTTSSLVIVGSHSGVVLCASTVTGETLWRVYRPTRFESPCSLYLNKYVVISGRNGIVYCLSLANGSPVWQCDIGTEIKAGALQVGTCLLVACYDGHMYCLDPCKRRVVWKVSGGGPLRSSPSVCHDARLIVLASLRGHVLAFKYNGNECPLLEWETAMGDPIFGSPCLVSSVGNDLHQNVAIVADVAGSVRAMSLLDGSSIWSVRVGCSIFADPLVMNRKDGQDVVITCREGILLALQVDSGKQRWRWLSQTGSLLHQSVVIGPQSLCTSSTMGELFLIETRNGGLASVRSTWHLPAEVYSAPVVAGDVIFIGCRDDCLHALQLS